MSNVIIIHGAYGYPGENWFPWLQSELTKRKIDCLVPQFPTPAGQTIANWRAVLQREATFKINEQTILIGHSLGVAFLLHWLVELNQPVKAVILVGGFLGEVGIVKFDLINQSFFSETIMWEKIKTKANKFIAYHSDNDPYVERRDFDVIAEKLSAQKIVVANAGHFNFASGYTTFPHLLLRISQLF